MSRNFFLCTLAILFAMLPAATRADDAKQLALVQETQNKALMAMPVKDFALLEKMADTFRNEKSRKPNGGWLIDVFYEAIEFIAAGPEAEKYFTEYSNIFDEWQKAYPNSPTPIIAKAELITNFAWSLRGNGTADTVFENQWKVFGEKITEAYQLLNSAPEFVKSDPRWYSLSVRLMKAMGASEEDIKKIALEGIKREPGYYRTYIELMISLAPWWGGSYEKMDAWILEASSRPEATDADGLYTRMYWSAQSMMRRADFHYLNIDWQRLLRETNLIIERYPSVANYEVAIVFSCLSEDPSEVRSRWAGFVNLAPELDPEIIPSEYCRWPAQQQRTPGIIPPDEMKPSDKPKKASVR